MPEIFTFTKADGTQTELTVNNQYALVVDGEPVLIWDIEDGYSVRILSNPEISETEDDIYTGFVLSPDISTQIFTSNEIETLALEMFRYVKNRSEW